MATSKTTTGIFYRIIYCASFVLLVHLPLRVQAQESSTSDSVFASHSLSAEKKAGDVVSLFTKDEVLHFKLVTNYQELLKDRGEERAYHEATLSYTDPRGGIISTALKVRVRGNRRRDPTVCDFPPLLLNFPRKKMQHTLFEGVNKLKLVTHCVGEDYVLREYLVYRLYNVTTENSFRVRLCRVDYEDLVGKRKTETRYAFLIEDDEDMALRNKGRLVSEDIKLRMDWTDSLAMARVALFQYMIGNTDWSLPYWHNIKLLSRDSLTAPIPVPYDFDYAGIVTAPYAVPPPELGITSVRQRLFRGYHFSDRTYAAAVSAFNKHKPAIYGVYQNFSLIDKSYLKRTLKYLDDFYETINDPKDFNNKIVRVGQQNQRKVVTVKGLK
ncbi:hypothetical protein CLV24_10743 [Pontibacter ummariensis]|uniref:Uncharacterized protein n=1 Tax=Pontibacter ummariensis TaxID=1610492 RepID=A0A239EZC3_9BACT|nr:hypothetical protein [Pontibacter ummariensis]PRY12672.1 hypothetical protein CLV24_10743 [Pontibacter ummariensis]SNS49945.1 hypothetical protein SAMN06296052_107145 [Pontibacter ummariensis]